MSDANTFITAVPVFEGAQGKYYVVDGKKYSVYFPIGWAHEHLTFQVGDCEDKSGPKDCGNCDAYGSIRGVFVGYCGNCLQHYTDTRHWRGNLLAPGISVEMLEDEDMWERYPYMSGISKSAIGDDEGADLTDQGVNLEQLEAAIAENEEEDEDNKPSDEEKENESYDSHENTDLEIKFDRNGRLVYPQYVLCELDRLDRKGLLYCDGSRYELDEV